MVGYVLSLLAHVIVPSLGTPCDKIFVASENEVRAYTKKGKLFLSFDSNMTEPITSM